MTEAKLDERKLFFRGGHEQKEVEASSLAFQAKAHWLFWVRPAKTYGNAHPADRRRIACY